ncbi:transferase 2, rSAM/selenodomain-associated [Fodinibius roseus]|uniref:Transferase 2, rSAM/selenodomain-associated n=1 Tax=Fodinibius roseus TaxID=1194090 RepID=A0A1M5ID16_9BACT|nr:TIGR04283 family arsenosugar biosynthesis glycosyltransferase [Fodinibius roseus]SHG26151.1 transferase 2, rSAM/selenodomain-associated [Fodinibius roseus]
MNISVIIPTYNEAEIIGETIGKVRSHGGDAIVEIIVVDGGSDDATVQEARRAGATTIKSPRKGRAAQMNTGAGHARGNLLYFLHADSHPPPCYATNILQAVDAGSDAGCFRLSFDDRHWLLRFYAWFTRFDIDLFRFGDQSLFMTRTAFSGIGGFREDHRVMEDQEIVRRVKRSFSFEVLDDVVTTSARKYRDVGIIRLQLVFGLIVCLYYLGMEQQKLVSVYHRFIPGA